jgi:hypothetical protein
MTSFSGFSQIGLQMYPAWTDRIAAGAIPPQAPPRPQGIELNLVVSMWDQATIDNYVHVLAAGGKTDSLVTPNTFIYSPGQSNDTLYWVDPVHNTDGAIKYPTRDNDLDFYSVYGGDGTLNPRRGGKYEYERGVEYQHVWRACNVGRLGQRLDCEIRATERVAGLQRSCMGGVAY